MSENNPPIPFPLNPIFNLSDWIIPNIALTVNMANQLYLKRAGDSATGLINFNSGLTCAGNCSISCNVLLTGVLATDRQLTLTYLNLTNANDNASTTQIYSNVGNTYYDNNINSSSHIFLTNNSSGIQTTPLQVNSNDLTIQTINPPTCNAVQPISTDSSTIIPTTAWVQSAISSSPSTQKTYTVQYTSSVSSITLPTNCIGIGIRCVGRGGGGGQAFDNNGGTWNAGGSGGGGGYITSNSIINLLAGQQIQINITVSLSEVIAIGFGQLCRAIAGSNGGNASASSGGAAGQGGAFVSNTSYGNWYGLVGSSGVAGGINLPFQSATYPASAGTINLQTWNPATVYGAGQNWNGSTTLNSFQGPAISTLSGTVYITYYLK